jgi:hypothetical protein
LATSYAKQFGLSGSFGGFGENFGFNNSLKFLGVAEGFYEYLIPFPRCRKHSGDCTECGTGSGDFSHEGRCFYCGGDGQESYYDYESEAFPILVSLSVLFEMMRFPETENLSANEYQLMTLDLQVSNEASGVMIGAEFSCDLVSYLTHRGEGEIREMVTAMRWASRCMEGRPPFEFERSRFRASVDDERGWLNVSCSGEACGLYPYDRQDFLLGYQVASHNVDQPIQQFTLLAALAALHDLARGLKFQS